MKVLKKFISAFVICSLIFTIVLMSGCNNKSENFQDVTEVSGIVEELSEVPTTPDASQEIQKTEEPVTDTAQEEISDAEKETEPQQAPQDTDEEPVTEQQAPFKEPVYVPVSSISLSIYDVTITVAQKTMPWVTMSPQNASNKGEIWTSSDTSIATVDGYGNITGVSTGSCTVTVTSSDNPEIFATVNVTVIPDAECTYIDGILIVNKTYPLPKSYAPGWDATASEKLLEMFAAAKDEEGLYYKVLSGYRSYVDQTIIYNGYVARDGQAAADRYSARPGHSEHQSGLAFDLNKTSTSFGETPEGIWLKDNCHRFGFIIRYPKDKEEITGYMYEPWHVRYLGVETATAVYESGLCLEEYLGITSVYSY